MRSYSPAAPGGGAPGGGKARARVPELAGGTPIRFGRVASSLTSVPIRSIPQQRTHHIHAHTRFHQRWRRTTDSRIADHQPTHMHSNQLLCKSELMQLVIEKLHSFKVFLSELTQLVFKTLHSNQLQSKLLYKSELMQLVFKTNCIHSKFNQNSCSWYKQNCIQIGFRVSCSASFKKCIHSKF